MPTLTKTWTEKELLALPHDGNKYELVDGEITTMASAGYEHGDYGSELLMHLRMHARKNKLGSVVGGDAGFWMKSGNMLSPDVSFVAQSRIKKLGGPPSGFFPGAPDLAVEVLSPDDTLKTAKRKFADYFASGTKLVWVINPKRQTVTIFHGPEEASKVCGIDDVLSGENVVPGFTLPLRDLFEYA